MRFALFLVLGVFLWAGTVSIRYPQQPSTVTASPANDCSGQTPGDNLLAYLKMGTITSIQDNGRILTIELSPQWGDFTPDVQQQAYVTVVCYAQSQHRPFKFLVSQQM